MSSLGYFFKESLRGFTRNLSTTLGSIVTIFLSLLIIGVFLVGSITVNNVMKSVESEVTIMAYVADDATDADIQTVENFIKGIDGVASVSFTTKEQALEKFRASSDSDIIDSLDGMNPLPASIDVELTDSQLVESVAAQIADNQLYRSICEQPEDPSSSLMYGKETVERINTLFSYVRYIGIVLVALLIFIAMVFINNTIRLAILARRKEIAIMRLVGASNGFIRGPFLMEGALHAVIGSLLAVGVLELLRNLALPQLQAGISFLSFDASLQTFLLIYVALIVAGLLIGLVGSAFAMRRYLKV